MAAKTITPALGDKSFSCPHCGAIAHQNWYKLHLSLYEKDQGPWFPEPKILDEFRKRRDLEEKDRSELIEFFEKMLSKQLFREGQGSSQYVHGELANLNVSRCYSCDRFSVWVADTLIHPSQPTEFQPNAEMPPDVALDFTEASTIVDKSPRGAAALLRLAIQRIMPHLGCKGKNLDDDIGELVKRGLDSRVQKALDVVRVIGNNAVHPGQIDLRDDKAIAVKLFDLVDLIVEAMIATPKHIEKMYGKLPEGALKAIEKRDGGSS